jgi:hypothetical protein
MEEQKRKSLCIRVCLYTLINKNVQENLYIEMFLIWLATVVKYAALDKYDTIHLITDKDTAEYLENETIFFMLQKSLNYPIVKFCLPRPSTNLEGMMYKYVFTDYTQDVFMYCDIDVMIVKPIHIIVNKIQYETIVVQHEGVIHETNYGAAFSSEELKNIPENTPGFSAGKFFIRGKELHKDFFKLIYDYYLQNKNTNYYTLEQPYFNKALFSLDITKINIDIDTLDNQIISNSNTPAVSCILLDHCGEPANGKLHFAKILDSLLLLYSEIL